MFGSVDKKNVLFALSVALSVLLAAVVAADTSDAVSEEYSGICGDNMHWSYQKNTLYLSTEDASVSAEMYDFTAGSAPWSDLMIKKLSFSGDILSIGDYAFAYSSLLNVKLPEGVRSVGEGAFIGSDSLYSVAFPSSLEAVGDRAFSGCSTLYCLNSAAEVHDGFYGSHVFEGTGFTTVPDLGGLESIPDGMFCNSALMNITVPDGIKSIGDGAFSGCGRAESIFIPSTVEMIGNSAFETDESSVLVIIIETEDSEMRAIGDRAFAGHCSVTGEVCVPAYYVGEEAFLGIGCSIATLGESVSFVGDRAFADSCISTVVLSDMGILSESVFENCGDILFVLPEITEISEMQDDMPGFTPFFGGMPSFFSLFDETEEIPESDGFDETVEETVDEVSVDVDSENAADSVGDEIPVLNSPRAGVARPNIMTVRPPVTTVDPYEEDLSVPDTGLGIVDVPDSADTPVRSEPLISGIFYDGYTAPADPAEDKSDNSMFSILLAVAAVLTGLVIAVVILQLKGRISN